MARKRCFQSTVWLLTRNEYLCTQLRIWENYFILQTLFKTIASAISTLLFHQPVFQPRLLQSYLSYKAPYAGFSFLPSDKTKTLIWKQDTVEHGLRIEGLFGIPLRGNAVLSQEREVVYSINLLILLFLYIRSKQLKQENGMDLQNRFVLRKDLMWACRCQKSCCSYYKQLFPNLWDDKNKMSRLDNRS